MYLYMDVYEQNKKKKWMPLHVQPHAGILSDITQHSSPTITRWHLKTPLWSFLHAFQKRFADVSKKPNDKDLQLPYLISGYPFILC